jgi:transposase InsO family protein
MDAARDPDPRDAIARRFATLYLTTAQRSVALCRDLVQGELELAQSPLAPHLPSVATFRRFAASIPRPTLILGREVPDAYRNQCEPYLERDYAEIPVMGMWVSDHMQFDQIRRHRGGHIRPWVTAWMDVRSRLRVGWCVCEKPSQDSTLAALAMGILRYGVPEALYSDNGREYAAKALVASSRRFRVRLDEARVRALTEHLGIRYQFSIPENPQSRGMIERAFGVDHDRFDRLSSTYCGRDPQHKPPELQAVLDAGGGGTYDELSAEYATYVKQVANVLPHEGDGMDGRSPVEVFESAGYVKRVATIEELRLLLMRASGKQVVRRNGIEAFGAWYRSDLLAARQGEAVYYRYALDDISELHVFDLEDRYLCTVQRKDRVGATAADHRQIAGERKRQKQLIKDAHAARTAIAAAPDPLAALAAQKRTAQARAIEHRSPSVVQPIRTPFKGLLQDAKVAQAEQARADQAKRDARAITRRLFAAAAAEQEETAKPSGPSLWKRLRAAQAQQEP